MEQNFEERLAKIEERNARVEADKAWELSITRRLSIAIVIYAVALVVLWSLKTPNFLLNAGIPVAGYVLSTQSLPLLKSWWLCTRAKR